MNQIKCHRILDCPAGGEIKKQNRVKKVEKGAIVKIMTPFSQGNLALGIRGGWTLCGICRMITRDEHFWCKWIYSDVPSLQHWGNSCLLYCWKRSYRLDPTKHRIMTEQKVIGTCDDKYLLSVCPILLKIKLDKFDCWHLLLANSWQNHHQKKNEKKNSKFWAIRDTLRLFAWSNLRNDGRIWRDGPCPGRFRTWTEIRRREKETWGK